MRARLRRMLAHERAELILARLRERGTVSAQELVRMLRVSAPTVRRDLERMEADGVLRRVHGGAYLAGGPAVTNGAGDNPAEAPFASVVADHAAEKELV